MIISLGIDKNCSYIYALPKREKDKESTIHTARTSTNMSLLLSTSAKVLTSSPPQRFHYEITRQALNKPSAFVRNTYNKKLYIPPYNDASWKAIQYFSWSSSPNYSAICTNVLQRITKNNTFYIIECKYQQVGGSVDEKLQTCDFKKKQYKRLLASLNFEVEYIYILNDWFKKPEYKDVLAYIHSVGCDYYFNYIPLQRLGLPVDN